MDINKFTGKEEKYFKVVDGKVIAVESVMYGDDDDIYDKKEYRFDLSRYEGPLDLLLFLIKRNKIEISDIFVSDITQQYLEIIEPMKSWEDTEIAYAGEFISMAAELIEYKSKRLIPTEQPDELVADDLPGNDLIRRLYEYDMYKQMAEKLRELETVNRFYREPVYTEDDYRIAIKDFDFSKMLDAYAKMMHRLDREEKLLEPKKIIKERYSVNDRINYLSRRVFDEKKVLLFDLFENDFNRVEVINTFLAMLELMKRQIITVKQDEAFSNIEIHLKEGVEAPVTVAENEDLDDKKEETEVAKSSGNS